MTYFLALSYWMLGMGAALFVATFLYVVYTGSSAWWRVNVRDGPYKYNDVRNSKNFEAVVVGLSFILAPPALYTLIVYLFF